MRKISSSLKTKFSRRFGCRTLSSEMNGLVECTMCWCQTSMFVFMPMVSCFSGKNLIQNNFILLLLMIPAKVFSHGNFILSAVIPYFLIPSKHLDISSSLQFILIHITNALCGSAKLKKRTQEKMISHSNFFSRNPMISVNKC